MINMNRQMIDRKTRNEIIELWRQRENKASIQRKTGVSQPTIRKIIREAGLDENSYDASSFDDTSNLMQKLSRAENEHRTARSIDTSYRSGENQQSSIHIAPKDVFIINLEQNWPYRSNTTLQCLYNGAPIWKIPRLLKPMYNDHVISRIMQEIERQGQRKIYEVTVIHYGYGREHVAVKMLNGYTLS